MRPDYLSYQRATSVSFLGLVIQGLLAAALVIYGVLAKDHAALTAGLFGAMGAVIWLALGIVFDQARRERIEAIEAETLGQDAAAASVFEATGDEFRVAARRLNAMYKVFFPIVSVLFGAALIGVGYLRFKTGQVEFHTLDAPAFRGWAIGIEAFIAVVLFLFARYAAGMARQTVWANLKAGAASAAGLSLMCVSLVVFHIVDIVGPDGPLRALRVVLPVALMVFGAEVFVNFVLDIYRPRKAGESPRPAFNSPLLGLVGGRGGGGGALGVLSGVCVRRRGSAASVGGRQRADGPFASGLSRCDRTISVTSVRPASASSALSFRACWRRHW